MPGDAVLFLKRLGQRNLCHRLCPYVCTMAASHGIVGFLSGKRGVGRSLSSRLGCSCCCVFVLEGSYRELPAAARLLSTVAGLTAPGVSFQDLRDFHPLPLSDMLSRIATDPWPCIDFMFFQRAENDYQKWLAVH